ncbi:MAG: carboxypeptidase-like regulatory domain-containing protein [Bacteroidetes bacterium]|nr:carboxypeptidase-like regulatory domain-containing protein [Bacteroidota bacterium]
MKNFVLLLLIISSKALLAQTISGTITDDKKHPIPFATVFVKELKFGTASNENGRFEIQLNQGDYTLSFQSLGYDSQTKKIQVATANQSITIVLKERIYTLKEVVVSGGKEDPAYAMMRKVISLAPVYNRQLKFSLTEIYLRGSFVVSKLSKLTKWLAKDELKKSKIEEGKTYLEESVNEVYYTYPNTIKQVVKSLHSTIPIDSKDQRKNAFNIGSGSIYDPNYFGQGVRSPIGLGAFNYYQFRYEGYQNEGDHIINKIKIIPKGKGIQYMSGYLYIVDKLWCIHSYDLLGEGMGVSSYRLQQLFAPVKNEAWLPISDHILYNFDVMGNKASMSFHLTRKYKDVKINPSITSLLPSENNNTVKSDEIVIPKKETKATKKRDEKIKQLMGKENPTSYEAYKMARLVKKQVDQEGNDSIKKNHLAPTNRTTVVDSNAVKMDSSYWNKIRPIPLAANEVKSIVAYDSTRLINKKNDSINATPKAKKFKLTKTILLGGEFFADTIKYWRFDGIISPTRIGFNTVDGWKYSISSSVYTRLKNYNSISAKGMIGYAFDRKGFLWNLQGQYNYNQGQNILQLGAEQSPLDFNNGGASSLENEISTLFFHQNLIRYYEKQNYWGQYSMYLATGLKIISSISISNNLPLTNHTDFSFFYKEKRNYSLNIPDNANYLMSTHHNTLIALELEYTPGQNYYLVKNNKVFTPSNYPTFSIQWKKGVLDLLGGETNYQFMKAAVHQDINIYGAEKINYIVSAGLFLNKKPTNFSEFNHFATQPLTVGVKDFYATFQLLDYYKYSTNDRFIEGHFNYSTPYLLLKRLPIIRNRIWTEKLMVNYLYTPFLKNYMELGYGIGNELYNIGVFGSFRNLNSDRFGVKVSLKIFNLK